MNLRRGLSTVGCSCRHFQCHRPFHVDTSLQKRSAHADHYRAGKMEDTSSGFPARRQDGTKAGVHSVVGVQLRVASTCRLLPSGVKRRTRLQSGLFGAPPRSGLTLDDWCCRSVQITSMTRAPLEHRVREAHMHTSRPCDFE